MLMAVLVQVIFSLNVYYPLSRTLGQVLRQSAVLGRVFVSRLWS